MENVAIRSLWYRIRAGRRRILALTAVGTILTGVVAFLLPPWYRATAELLPPSQDEAAVGIASLLRGVAMPGVKMPNEATPADIFVVILGSRRISEQMVDRFDLKALYKKKLMEDAVKELHDHARFKVTDQGTVRITVEDMSRKRAADMANAYVEMLDRFNREVRMTKGRRTRIFVEGRLAETRQELTAAEQRLAQYQVKNKTVALSPEISSAVEEAARLYARRTALQVRLGVVRGYSAGGEEEIQVQQELDQLDRQMRALPTQGVELANLTRDVKALTQVLAILTAQYEEARINEARDVETVEVLDEAIPPERKVKPRRSIMVATAFLLSLMLGVGNALLRNEEDARPRPLRAVASE